MRPAWILASMISCSGGAPTTVVPGDPICDGLLQEGEGVIDGPWDQDGDGHMNDADPDCIEHYGANRLDCDDTEASINASRTEIPCNGLDDDCNNDTPDVVDRDEDGSPACDDCDDENPLRSPDFAEECWDEIDNNCNGLLDEGCPPNWNGTFQLDQEIHYSCFLGKISFGFSELEMTYNPPGYGAARPIGSALPGTMSGELGKDGSFRMRRVINGDCHQEYTIEGQFINDNQFEATYTATFGNPLLCLNCNSPRVYEIIGTRTLLP